MLYIHNGQHFHAFLLLEISLEEYSGRNNRFCIAVNRYRHLLSKLLLLNSANKYSLAILRMKYDFFGMGRLYVQNFPTQAPCPRKYQGKLAPCPML